MTSKVYVLFLASSSADLERAMPLEEIKKEAEEGSRRFDLFTCKTLEKILSTMLLSSSPHSTFHCSPSWKLSISIQLPNTGLLSSGTARPAAVVIDRILRVRKVAIVFIFSARLSPVSVGSTVIHTRCSLFIDCTVIWRPRYTVLIKPFPFVVCNLTWFLNTLCGLCALNRCWFLFSFLM